MDLNIVCVPGWPRLAWLAVCPPSSSEITCFVGDHVETADGWLCEAAWAGPYCDGGFDETDVVFGSGVRLRRDAVMFVSSGSTTDRLHSVRTDDGLCVSNSLACLLSFAGGSLLLTHTRYRDDFLSLRGGLGHYQRELPTTIGPVRLTYFHNLRWDGIGLHDVEKPFGSRDFSTFANYRAFLGSSVRALTDNGQAAARRHPFDLIATLSSGYDSSAAAVLASEAGCREAFSFDRGKEDRDDRGTGLATALDLRLHVLETAEAPEADVLFLAAGSGDGGDVMFKSAEALMAGRLVFTGHWGDRVWGLQETTFDVSYPRADTSGADFLEYRLAAGFINVDVPFLGGRQLEEVRSIATSSELAPWSVERRYNRPIARRIVEEAGVPRDAFGVRKEALFRPPPSPHNFLTPELRRDYHRWLASRRWQFVRRRAVPPSRAWDKLTVLAGVDRTKRRRLHKYVIHWAVDRAKEQYPRPSPTEVQGCA